MPPPEQPRRAADGRGPETEGSLGQLERWTRVKALFLEALAYPDSERSAYVALASGGDADLRKELESLLASEKAAASFCERPAAGLLRAASLAEPETVPRLPPGTRLGAYEISGFIAAGGMGAVYRARHTLLGREVAIKTIGQAAVNTWHFKADNVPDMAFGLSDHYVWDAASVVVDDATHRRASVQAAFNDSAVDYHHMAQFGRHALDWLSHNWPGVPYPYEKTTVFEGPAGMEYPMMANDASYPDTTFSKFVAEHEIAHTYFPFYMGINETRYGFMDEGWATTFEYLIGEADIGKERAVSFFQQFRVNGWAGDPSPLEDLPIITPADVLKNVAYGSNAYGKPALGYLAVKDLLGDAAFRKSLREFMNRWHGKHPIPWDFFNTFNDVSGKNLDWFWHNWYFTNNYIDLAVASVGKTSTGYSVVIANIGGMAAPVDLRVRYTDGSTDTIHETPAIWESSERQAAVAIATKKAIQSIALEGGIWVDADRSNNMWTAK
ncbi:MAG: M1 family aminopeptidase [Gemmatimonadaceae bacterium]